MARVNIYYINIINGNKSYQLSLKHLNKSRTYKSMTTSIQHSGLGSDFLSVRFKTSLTSLILFNISYALHGIKIHYDSRSKSHSVTQSKILCLIILLLHLGTLTSDSNTLYHIWMPSVHLQVIHFRVFTAVHIIPNIYRNIW